MEITVGSKLENIYCYFTPISLKYGGVAVAGLVIHLNKHLEIAARYQLPGNTSNQPQH